ncbi:TetR/AcrR family transcriptional regulator [Occultella glacieicola]|uniref:TetR/AcrR family transcriptional regulator n=1 Tax=Occultella glacieicola TaxID=2518684 RepID=A0ABY2E254_9MICO|nr:TetR/AcrR family transcriptional regulator [Occultella glacieicola]TDE92685.1 TetR/AcrR family transcriptional regulator [Occultella glacieicola]
MARTLDPQAHRRKREAILDVLEHLIVTRGYDRVTIADILGAAGISKGAFYHYFQAKDDVLTALLERRLRAWEVALAPIVERPGPALDRLRAFLATLSGAKSADREFLVEAAAPVLAESNAIVAARLRREGAARLTPLVTRVLTDARDEGSITQDDPAALADIVITLVQDLADRSGRAILAIMQGSAGPDDLRRTVTAHVGALQRVLALDHGELDFVTGPDIEAWASAAARRRVPEEK